MNYKIKNGLIVDPSQNLNCVQKDILIKEGSLVSNFEFTDKFEEINCENMIIMAGGIDLHTHIGGGKTNISRLLLPEDHYLNQKTMNPHEFQSSGFCTPGTLQTGYRYTEMGYTAAFEPAMIFSNARHAHMSM